MVKTRRFHCQGTGSVPGQGTKIPARCVVWPKEKINKNENIPHLKNKREEFGPHPLATLSPAPRPPGTPPELSPSFLFLIRLSLCHFPVCSSAHLRGSRSSTSLTPGTGPGPQEPLSACQTSEGMDHAGHIVSAHYMDNIVIALTVQPWAGIRVGLLTSSSSQPIRNKPEREMIL